LSIEKQSEHPLAEAVVKHLDGCFRIPTQLSISTVLQVKEQKQTTTTKPIYVGNKKLLAENNITIADELQKQAEEWGKQSKTVIWFANSKQALSVIAISDKIKETSVQAIEEMQDMGIDLYMLTGDNEATAKAIAEQSWHQTLQSRSIATA
jgi:Cu2+-exporting ATPase